MPEKRKTKLSQRIIILVSGLMFLGSTAFALLGLFTIPSPSPQAENPQANQTNETQLKQQEKGYETVLAREPDNVVALRGLVDTRLALNNFQSAIAPLEKLIKLDPQDPNLKALLDFVKQKAAPTPSQPSK